MWGAHQVMEQGLLVLERCLVVGEDQPLSRHAYSSSDPTVTSRSLKERCSQGSTQFLASKANG